MENQQIFVGNYNIGWRPVRLYVDPNTGDASVDPLPKDKGPSKVIIGLDQAWPSVLSVVLHEAYEIGLIDVGTRYRNSPVFTNSSSAYIFIVEHNTLDEVHERVAEFLVTALADVKKAYKKYKPKKEGKRGKKNLVDSGHPPEARENENVLPATGELHGDNRQKREEHSQAK